MQLQTLVVIVVLYAIILLGVHFIYKDCGASLGSETAHPVTVKSYPAAAGIPGNTIDSSEDNDLLAAQQERQVISELAIPPPASSYSAIPLPLQSGGGVWRGPPAANPNLMTESYDDMSETEPNPTVVMDDVSEGIKIQDYPDPIRVQAGGGRGGFADKLERALNAPPQRHRTPREQFEILQANAQPLAHPPAAHRPAAHLRPSAQPLRSPPSPPSHPHPSSDHVASVIGRQGRILNVEPKVVYPSEDGTWGADVADPNPQNHNSQISFSPEQRIMAAQRANHAGF